MKRKEDESFADYRERRRLDNETIEKHLIGKRIKHTRKEAHSKAMEAAKQFRENISS